MAGSIDISALAIRAAANHVTAATWLLLLLFPVLSGVPIAAG